MYRALGLGRPCVATNSADVWKFQARLWASSVSAVALSRLGFRLRVLPLVRGGRLTDVGLILSEVALVVATGVALRAGGRFDDLSLRHGQSPLSVAP